jgi:cytochrome c oxidase subunit 2
MSTSADARVIEITAKNFAFAPNSISVKKGEKVKLRITSTEGNLGFGIPDLGINTVINDGKTVEIELPTDEAGTFSFLCTVPCGPGHMDMKGTIVIS